MRMNLWRVPLRIALAGSFLAGAPLQVLAQRPEPAPIDLAALTLEELLRITVTTASKKPESLFGAPAIMVVLTESDIQSYGGRSLVEVLDRTTSVFFMGTQENLQGALTIRGDATLGSNNHVLILVNGRPIQESTHGGMVHPFLRAFPLASVKQIEIIRGPGSVLYGTNAYVGVINVITKEWDAAGVAGVSYGSFDTTTLTAAGGTAIGGLRVSAGTMLSHDGGWDFTATDSIDAGKPAAITRTVPWFDRKVGVNLNAKYKGLSVDTFYARAETPHLTNSTATTSWGRYGVSTATQALLAAGYEHQISARWTSSLSATFNHFVDHADFGEIGKREVRSNGFVGEWVNGLSLSRSVNAVVGANFSKRTGSFYEATYDWYDVPYYDRYNVTAFAQVDYQPVPRFKLIAGGQIIETPGFTTHVTGGQSGETSEIAGHAPHLVGRLGGVVTLTRNLGAKVLYSQAFRQPSVVETDLVRYDEGDYTQEGNPTLKPEAIATTDLQLYYGNDRMNAAVTLFDSRQSDVIVETEEFVLIQNSDRSHTQGIESEALIRPMRNLELTAAVTYLTLNNQNDRVSDDAAVPVPRLMAKVGISYRTASGLTLGLYDSYFGTPRENRRVEPEEPESTTQFVNPTARAFHNVTVNVAYRLKHPAFLPSGSHLTAHVYASNLLNEGIYYAEYTSVNVNSIPGRPGRAVFAGFTFGF